MKKKRKINKKKKSKKRFFDNVESCLVPAIDTEGLDCIITDAGFDSLDYKLASKCFDYYEIIDWWSSTLDTEEFSREFPTNVDIYNPEENKKALEYLVSKYDWLSQEIRVVTAKAFYDLDYQWVEILSLSYGQYEADNFDYYEEMAILLGRKLKEELGQENLLILNDNQNAVLSVNGISDYYRWDKSLPFEEDEIVNTPTDVFWIPREQATLAHNLKVERATKIIFPDEPEDDLEA